MIYITSPTLPSHVKRQVMSVKCVECKSFDLTHRVNIFISGYVRTVHTELTLNKQNRENCIMELKTVKTVRLYGREPTRKAAVLVPLCTVNRELSFNIQYGLQIRTVTEYRCHFLQAYKTKYENVEETAFLETLEEFGIERTQIDVWGNGRIVGTRQKVMAVMPLLVILEKCLLKDW
jgi:hypothetical protein